MPLFRLARRHLPRIAVLVAAVTVASTLWSPHPEASPSPVAQNRPPSAPVQLRDLSFKPDDVQDMGASYYAFEKRSGKVTAIFSDSVAIAERTTPERVDVQVKTRVNDTTVGRMASVALTNGRHAVGFEGTTPADRLTTAIEDSVHPTADWAALQARALWRDKASRASRGLGKRGRFLQPRGVQPADLEDGPLFLVSEFPDDIQVTTHRRFKSVEFAQKATAPYYITTVLRKNLKVGEMWWYPHTQTLEWKFPSLTEGSLSPKILAGTPAGGWTFRPTPAWANIQAYAFYERHTAVKAEAQLVARAKAPSGVQRLAAWLVPSLHASDGCDFLHWLDGSVLRPCCDAHDKCYETFHCGMLSWIDHPTGSGWICDACNIEVMICFLAGGPVGGSGGSGESGGGSGGGSPSDELRGGTSIDVCSHWAGDYCEYPSDCCDGGCDENFCSGG